LSCLHDRPIGKLCEPDTIVPVCVIFEMLSSIFQHPEKPPSVCDTAYCHSVGQQVAKSMLLDSNHIGVADCRRALVQKLSNIFNGGRDGRGQSDCISWQKSGLLDRNLVFFFVRDASSLAVQPENESHFRALYAIGAAHGRSSLTPGSLSVTACHGRGAEVFRTRMYDSRMYGRCPLQYRSKEIAS